MFKGEMRRVGPPKSLDEARRLIKGYVVYCNNVHLNGAIGYIAAFSSARRAGNPAAGGAAHAQMTIPVWSLIRGRLPARLCPLYESLFRPQAHGPHWQISDTPTAH
jgi:hypothetical protein